VNQSGGFTVAQRFQLILQFEAEKPNDFDDLVRIENVLRDELAPKADVDGHDVGAGEFNIFIFTGAPEETFHRAHALLSTHGRPGKFRAAYREPGAEEFVILWPRGLSEFTIA
jgi:hypothetical protein